MLLPIDDLAYGLGVPRSIGHRLIQSYLAAELDLVSRNCKRLAGPKIFPMGPADFTVISVMKNSAPYIRPFIDYYRNRGARHIILMDNGSTDDTVKIVKSLRGVTLLSCLLPFKTCSNAMKRYMSHGLVKNGWIVLADIDEFLDYPNSDRVGMGGLLKYLNREKYTAVVTQMLDLFPEGPLLGQARESIGDFRSMHRFYDNRNLGQVSPANHHLFGKGNVVANPAVKFLTGGLRLTFFNSNSLLSKTSLFKASPDRFVLNSHSVCNSNFADITAVLLHYKFLADFGARVKSAVTEKTYPGLKFYQDFQKGLESTPHISLKTEHAREFRETSQLVEEGFLVSSKKYDSFAHGPAPLRKT